MRDDGRFEVVSRITCIDMYVEWLRRVFWRSICITIAYIP